MLQALIGIIGKKYIFVGNLDEKTGIWHMVLLERYTENYIR